MSIQRYASLDLKYESWADSNDEYRVIRYHLQDKEFEPVLTVLEEQLKRGKPQLFYQYGPKLMQTIPRRFVDSLMSKGAILSPLKLIPSLLVNARTDQELEAIRYLGNSNYFDLNNKIEYNFTKRKKISCKIVFHFLQLNKYE